MLFVTTIIMTSRAKRRQRYFWHEKREIFRFVHALHKRRWAYVVLFTPYIPIHLVPTGGRVLVSVG